AWVNGSTRGRDGAYLMSAPSPPAAIPATAFAASLPAVPSASPTALPNDVPPAESRCSPGQAPPLAPVNPDGAPNAAACAVPGTSTDKNSVTCGVASSDQREQRSRMPSSVSTTASTCSSQAAMLLSHRGMGANSPAAPALLPSRLRPTQLGRSATARTVPRIRTPVRPATVTSSSRSSRASEYPVSSQDGASRERYGGCGRSDPEKPNWTVVSAERSRNECHIRVPSQPSAHDPSAPSAR